MLSNITDSIAQHARNTPDLPAVKFAGGEISWRQLESAISSATRLYRDCGLRPGDMVGVTVRDSVSHLLSALGLARMGVTHVALSASEPSAGRKATAIKLGLKGVVAEREADGFAEFPVIPSYQLGAGDRLANDGGLHDQASANAWLILQSSGTTGAPKHAVLTHAGALARAERFRRLYDCGPGDVFWPVSHLDFVVAKQRAFYALHTGAALCLPDAGIEQGILPFLRASGVTLGCGTPSHLYQWLALREEDGAMPSLRAFEVRSATISEPLRKAFHDRFGPRLNVVYGTNEGDALTIAPHALQVQVPNTVGRAAPGMELQVVDGSGNPVGPGVVGEVRVRGEGVISSYRDNPEASSRSFREGWFHPGDLASWGSDQALVLHGRTDDMMIFDGMNIYPSEIESVLADHPAIRDVAAFAIEHERFQHVPVAAVTVRQHVDAHELVRYARRRIGIKHPRMIFILDEFPRNAMGKILKRKLAEYVNEFRRKQAGQQDAAVHSVQEQSTRTPDPA